MHDEILEMPLKRSPVAGGPLASIRGLSAGFESEVVLKEISFEIPPRGIFGVLGPAGVGKSTLLRTLGRWNDPLPSFWVHGRIDYRGRDLLRDYSAEEARREFALLAQKARLYTATILDNLIADVRPERPLRSSEKRDLAHGVLAPLGLWDRLEPLLNDEVLSLPIGAQRQVSLARLVAGGAVAVLADEPLRDISESEAGDLARFLRTLSDRVAVVMVTHNQTEARELCDDLCLLAAGRVVEVTPAEEFFERPRTELGARFLRFGNCWPDEPEPPADSAGEPSWAPAAEEKVARPSGFHWILQGLLGGMAQPGLLRAIDRDLKALRQLGCRRLVTLTEETCLGGELGEYAIVAEHFPIVDMGAPNLSDALVLCRRVSSWVDQRLPTVLHCRAGLGRTGTMLACTLIYRGESAVRAISQVRSINPYYIQSEEQIAFIAAFARALERETSPAE